MSDKVAAEHPGMRLTVYRVDPRTFQRTPVSDQVVHPGDTTEPIMSMIFPPCQCLRCRK